MKFKFIQNHSLTALLKAILYIAIVSGIYFGINALARVNPTVTSYTLTMACCAILLHFYDKEDEK